MRYDVSRLRKINRSTDAKDSRDRVTVHLVYSTTQTTSSAWLSLTGLLMRRSNTPSDSPWTVGPRSRRWCAPDRPRTTSGRRVLM